MIFQCFLFVTTIVISCIIGAKVTKSLPQFTGFSAARISLFGGFFSTWFPPVCPLTKPRFVARILCFIVIACSRLSVARTPLLVGQKSGQLA